MTTTFHDYYRGEFRADFRQIYAPARHRHDAFHYAFAEPSLQPHALERHRQIRRWNRTRKEHFALSLFLTVLADQVCYTHFREAYRRFRELTMYPKLKGECPASCNRHVHPVRILRIMNPHTPWRPESDEALIACVRNPEVLARSEER